MKSIIQTSCSVVIIALLMMVFVNEDFTQSVQMTPDPKVDKCGKDCIVKEQGFLLPKFRSEKILKEKVFVLGENRVVEKRLDVDPKFIALSENFIVNNENVLDVTVATELATHSAYRYEVNERIFAFKVFYNPIMYSEAYSADTKESFVIKSRSRCLMGIFYIDKDGDGVFETMYKSLDLPIEVPLWAVIVAKKT